MDKSAFGQSPARRVPLTDVVTRVLTDPLLSRVVEAWPKLPPDAREAVVGIVEDAVKEGEKHAPR